MAYRGERNTPGTVCFRHPAAEAAASCLRCEKAICEICVMYHGAQPHCPACARRAARMQSLGRLAVVGGILALAGAGITYVATRKLPFDYIKAYGKAGPYIAGLAAQVDKEPCQRRAALDLANALINAGDNRASLARTSTFFAKCGDWPRLRWATYSAHKHLGEWQLAADEATKLMTHDPYDHDFPWWRGQAYEELGRFAEAAADYRMTVAMLPNVEGIPFNLSTVLEKQGKYCEAVQPVEQYLHFHPDVREHDNVRRRLERLTGPGRCEVRAGRGSAVIPLDGEGWGHPDRALINGIKAKVRVDADVPYVIIGPSLAGKLGLDLHLAPSLRADLNGEVLPGRLTTLKSLEVGGAHAQDVEAVVVDQWPGEAIIGLSFLTRFELDEGDTQIKLDGRP